MNAPHEAGSAGRVAAGARSESRERLGLAAAYREGLGLAAVAVICGPAGIRITAAARGDQDAFAAAESVQARWWCRCATEAARVAAAARARLRRRESRGGDATPSPPALAGVGAGASPPVLLACASVEAAAKRFNIVLRTDDDILDEAMNVVARVDAEMQKLQHSGGLKSINKAYRSYRLEASGRGERVLRYDEWMGKYRENLVRQLASTFRYV
jgi:hypothetical protein